MKLKTEALLATARAYYNRGPYIQYDQLSMDRILQVSPRRQMYAAPEAATRQRTLFLDCSSLVWAIYHNAFGYALEGDVTWDMIDLGSPRVYYRTFSAPPAKAEAEAVTAELTALLQTGDVILFSEQGNGHAMLYLGGGKYLNCSGANIPGSYDYKTRTDVYRPEGALLEEDITWLFAPTGDPVAGRNYLFAAGIKRIAVLRPLEKVGPPTRAALARLGPCKDLVCGVECSHPGGRTAMPGDVVAYTIWVRNLAAQSAEACVTFNPAPGTKLRGASQVRLAVAGGAEGAAGFEVTVSPGPAAPPAAPAVTVNDLGVAAPPLLVGQNLATGEAGDLVAEVTAAFAGGEPILAAAASAYQRLGIGLPKNEAALLFSLFYRHDAVGGAVFSRRTQCPERDRAVHGLYGGYGVITPDAAYALRLRATRVTRQDLQAGDIVLCCDDALMETAYAALYTGEGLVGCFGPDTAPGTLTATEADRFIESLFGRFCFVVLRPSLVR